MFIQSLSNTFKYSMVHAGRQCWSCEGVGNTCTSGSDQGSVVNCPPEVTSCFKSQTSRYSYNYSHRFIILDFRFLLPHHSEKVWEHQHWHLLPGVIHPHTGREHFCGCLGKYNLTLLHLMINDC